MTSDAAPTSARLLRLGLRANAVFSASTGAAALVAGGAIAERAGIDPPWLVRLGGLGLLVFAAGLIWLAGRGLTDLRNHTPGIVVADLGWIVATALVLALGWLTDDGRIGAVVIAAVVGVVAGVQFLGWRELRA